ncbi:MAG TPA: hypothetical protein ENF43_00080 [Thermoplasmatales archaeon]|nr:hypothetical protein [Thermoplasmatales archaeon]
MKIEYNNLVLVCEKKNGYFECKLLKRNELLTKITLDEFGGTVYLSPKGEVRVDIGKPFNVEFEWE